MTDTRPDLGWFAVGRDDKAKYGPGWEDAYLAGYQYTDYDDQEYFTVDVLFLVHPDVPRDQDQVLNRLGSAFRESLGMGPEDDDTGIFFEEENLYFSEIDNVGIELLHKHGVIPAYQPYAVDLAFDGFDGDHLLTLEDESEVDEDEDAAD